MNGIDDIETGEEPVARLLSELDRVEAPGHFETRVMARIAERRDAPAAHAGLSLGLRFAAPLVLLLMVGGFLAYIGYDRGEPLDITQPAERTLETPPAGSSPTPVTETDQFAVVDEPASAVEAPAATAERRLPATRRASTANDNRGEASFETAANPETPLLPEGIAPVEPSSANRAEVITRNSVPVSEVLKLIGITAAFENGWRVRSVSANSLADRSGVKPGDVVTALDDRKLAADTQFAGDTSAGTTISVTRGGEALVLSLKPN